MIGHIVLFLREEFTRDAALKLYAEFAIPKNPYSGEVVFSGNTGTQLMRYSCGNTVHTCVCFHVLALYSCMHGFVSYLLYIYIYI